MTLLALKLARGRRAAARRPLITLLQWVVVHAMRPHEGRPATAELVDEIVVGVRVLLDELANAGAFLYFGIASPYDLGKPPVALRLVDDGRHDLGTVTIDHDELVAWLFRGGARGQGWRAPGELTAEDLG